MKKDLKKHNAFTLAEGATHVGIFHITRRVAFTLAEVLITLGIIGIVSAMTIPTLVTNYQERSFNTSATVFERKLGEALKVMNNQQTLAGHNSTESFVEELGRHFKINRVCNNDRLLNCFEEEVFWGSGTATSETVDLTEIKLAKHLGQKEWQQTNVVGVQFANGTTALIAYNKDTVQDPYSNEIVSISGSSNGKSGSVSLGTTALAILYDTNGAKSPNKSTKDLRSINVTKLGKDCFAKIDGLCIAMQPQKPTVHKWNACNTSGKTTDPDDLAFMSKYGISKCMNSSHGVYDSWAGAVKLCGGVSKMATEADLVKIANYIYNTDNVTVSGTTSNLTFDMTKATELGLPSERFFIWSSTDNGPSNSIGRAFNNKDTSWSNNYRKSGMFAVCIDK